MQVDFHPAATVELTESAEWYGQRSAVAARDFLVAVDVAIRNITDDPDRFARLDDRHCGCSVKKFPFPFQIVFRQHDDRIRIIAIAHAKRRPSYWRDR